MTTIEVAERRADKRGTSRRERVERRRK
jgi:hypothetical protein